MLTRSPQSSPAHIINDELLSKPPSTQPPDLHLTGDQQPRQQHADPHLDHPQQRHHSAYQPQHSTRNIPTFVARHPTIAEDSTGAASDKADPSEQTKSARGSPLMNGNAAQKVGEVLQLQNGAGVKDEEEEQSYSLKGLRLAPLSMSSRDHRDGWLHLEGQVRQAAAAAVAVAPKGQPKSTEPEKEKQKEKQKEKEKEQEKEKEKEQESSLQRRKPDGGRSTDNLESLLSPSMRSLTASPRHYTPSLRSGTNTPSGGIFSSRGDGGSTFVVDHMVMEAWENLRRSRVFFRGSPVGTIAAMDSSEAALNYDQVFVRDFVPSALAFLMNGEPEIVRHFLLKTLRLQSWEKRVDVFTLGEGVMPASFKVLHDPKRNLDTMVADFGESAIGRVAPVDSGFWWIILLRAYVKSTGDTALAESPDCQRGMRLILNLCLSDGFDTFPTLLCADGCCMVDRRMGIYGYPIEIQSLFYMALRIARGLLRPDLPGNKELLERIDKRLVALSFHMRTYFWLDHEQLNNIYRYKTEEYSHTAVNKFNVIPDSIPDWLFDFMPTRGGYFIGNVSPARMDFRWFALGNCVAILACLSTREQACAIMDLIEERWDELMGEMPLKVAYPALEGHEWKITTGCDPKNTRWSYHNGGSWPVLLWLLTAASIKVGRPHIARRAIEVAELRLSRDGWPEYYDGKLGRYVGKQARKLQMWSIAGYLVSKMLLEDPSHIGMIALEEERRLEKPPFARSNSWQY